MASTKEYCDYVLEQLSEVPDIACRSMMGEFLLYSAGVLFGGIYDESGGASGFATQNLLSRRRLGERKTSFSFSLVS